MLRGVPSEQSQKIYLGKRKQRIQSQRVTTKIHKKFLCNFLQKRNTEILKKTNTRTSLNITEFQQLLHSIRLCYIQTKENKPSLQRVCSIFNEAKRNIPCNIFCTKQRNRMYIHAHKNCTGPLVTFLFNINQISARKRLYNRDEARGS